MAVHPLRDVLPGNLKNLKPIMTKWASLMDTLAKEWAPEKFLSERDCPWWYAERSAVGFFAASAWLRGGEAIEEYATDKRTLRRRCKKSEKRNGRGDLMFSLNGRRSSTWFVAEAKQSYPCLNGSFDVLKHCVKSNLRKARQDARNTKNFGYARLGLLFLCPYATGEPPSTKEIRQWIGRLLTIAKKQKAALAYTFPSIAHDLRDRSSKSKNKHYYPGVALLIRPPRGKI